MRRAELVLGIVMAVISLGFMWKSAEFNIGWIPGQGPGGGAFTFWLGVGMLICAATIIIRWFLGVSPLSRSTAIYMDFYSFRMFLIGVGSLAVTIGLFHVVGVYVALPLFLMFYLRVVGRHSWRLIGPVAFSTPIIAFFLFEVALNVTLPKGVTETLFYPVYDLVF